MHTPGPWMRGGNEPFVYSLNEAGSNRFFLQVQPGWITEGPRNGPNDPRTSEEELMANARLIAAAPDLLAALEKCVTQLEIVLPVTGRVHDERQALIDARAAIAKAKLSPRPE